MFLFTAAANKFGNTTASTSRTSITPSPSTTLTTAPSSSSSIVIPAHQEQSDLLPNSTSSPSSTSSQSSTVSPGLSPPSVHPETNFSSSGVPLSTTTTTAAQTTNSTTVPSKFIYAKRDRRRPGATHPRVSAWTNNKKVSFQATNSSNSLLHLESLNRRRGLVLTTTTAATSYGKPTCLRLIPSARTVTSIILAASFICVLAMVTVSRLNSMSTSKTATTVNDIITDTKVIEPVHVSSPSSVNKNSPKFEFAISADEVEKNSVDEDDGKDIIKATGTIDSSVTTNMEHSMASVHNHNKENRVVTITADIKRSSDDVHRNEKDRQSTIEQMVVNLEHDQHKQSEIPEVAVVVGKSKESLQNASTHNKLSSSSFSAVSKSANPSNTNMVDVEGSSTVKSDILSKGYNNTEASDFSSFSQRTTLNYFHLHKTGGISYKDRLYSFFYAAGRFKHGTKDGRINVFDTCHVSHQLQTELGREAKWACDWSNMLSLSESERDSIDFVIGHQYWDEGAAHFIPKRDLRYFTILRHPLHRKVSFFYHFFARNAGRKEADVSAQELKDFILGRSFGQHKKHFVSPLLRDAGPAYYASRLGSDGIKGFGKGHQFHLKDEQVSKLVDRLRRKFVFIGLQSQEDASLCMLEKTVEAFCRGHGISNLTGIEQISKTSKKRLNSGSYALNAKVLWEESMSPTEREEYKKIEHIDLNIYNEGVRLFRETARRLACHHLIVERDDEYMGL